MGGYVIALIFCLLLNVAVSIVVSMLIPNYYLASIITSIIISFIYSLFNFAFDRKHFYKYPQFWTSFFIMGTVFLLIDMFTFMF